MGKHFRNKWPIVIAAACGAWLIVPAARADLTVSFTPSSDAMIFGTSTGGDTGNASGMGPALFAGADGQGNIKRSMLEFNVSSIPAGATITSATLTLYLGQVAGSSGSNGTVSNTMDRQFGLYDLLQSWTEGTSGSPTSSNIGGSGQGYAHVNGDVTWTDASYNSNASLAIAWGATAAGSTTTPLLGGNFSTTESALLDVPVGYSLVNDAAFSWSSAGMAADVQGWLDGTLQNDGWLLRSDNLEAMHTSFLGFWSKDGAAAVGNSALTPTLTVTYTVPEPASLLLLAAAPLLLVRRRDRRRA